MEKIEEINLFFLIDQSKKILLWGMKEFQSEIFATTAFGVNGVVLLNLMREVKKNIPIYFINTGYHFDETIQIKESYKKKGFNIIEVLPPKKIVGELYKKDPDLCCYLNKVEPLKEIFKKRKGNLWITAISKTQTDSRKHSNHLEEYENNIFKLNPLLFWTEENIWSYIRKKNIEYNKLYDSGYLSIGCKFCTTPVQQGENRRAGRWKDFKKTECGIHVRFKKKI